MAITNKLINTNDLDGVQCSITIKNKSMMLHFLYQIKYVICSFGDYHKIKVIKNGICGIKDYAKNADFAFYAFSNTCNSNK